MATEVTLEARPRSDEEHGTRACRRLRNEGLVPAVIYGRGADVARSPSTHSELSRALTTDAGLNVLINLEVTGDSGQLAMARQISRHPSATRSSTSTSSRSRVRTVSPQRSLSS